MLPADDHRIDDPSGDALTRRNLLKRSGVAAALTVGGSGFLAACGSGGGAAGAASGGARKPTQMPSSAAKAPAASGTLDFVGFEGDDLAEILKPWYARSAVKLNPNYQSAETRILARVLSAGGRGTDLISLTSGYSPEFARTGALQPLDVEKLPNLRNIWPFFAQDRHGFFTNANGEWIALPQYWGGIGLAWDTAVLPEVTSWEDIKNPAFKGKVVMIDFPESIIQGAAVAIGGINPARMTTDDLARVKEWLKPVVAQVKTFSSSFGDIITLLASGEASAVMPGYPFLVNQAAKAGKKTLKSTADLKEGAIGAVEVLGIPKGADNTDTAYAFLNEMLARPTAAAVADLQGSPGVVQGLDGLVKPATKASGHFADVPGFYDTLKLWESIPRKSSRFVTQQQAFAMWTELKASAKA